ncbi:4-hydroxy-4-methyl-2-oxoglutarate aldolase [Vanrija pseudolonga]|uniref:4-hydroxy-4-methyl-2-oxoglutarate aldolase n=1 Tax=Vanrija pseudolonga TaxID=143232 RepID=A0AAF0YAX3_9TREE|nr:4-hydroxy-4-methyl-2-oxoglutarate aldolase [Vanrija pseudolonga]
MSETPHNDNKYNMAARALASKLREISTCDIGDTLVKLGVPSGGLVPDLKMYSPLLEAGDTRIAGPAFTVEIVPVSHPDKSKPAEHFVDAAPPGSVIFISTPQGTRSACWGGLMSAGAQTKGVVGAVVDGGIRDLSEQRALGFPVFGRHHSILGPSTFTRVRALQATLTIDTYPPHAEPRFPSTTVRPGDIVVADLDGVVVVPVELAEEVIAKVGPAAAADEKVRADLLAGKGVAESMLKWRGKVP